MKNYWQFGLIILSLVERTLLEKLSEKLRMLLPDIDIESLFLFHQYYILLMWPAQLKLRLVWKNQSKPLDLTEYYFRCLQTPAHYDSEMYYYIDEFINLSN